MKRSFHGPLNNAKRVNQGNDRVVPDIDPGGPSTRTDDTKKVRYGDPVNRFSVKKAGNYILGPLLGNSPIECLQQRLARKSGTNEFYVLKILTLDKDVKTDKDARDMMQGKVLLHSEYKLLSLCRDIEGVIRSHGLFSDFVFEEKHDEPSERSPNGQIYTGKILKRIILVLDCIYPHEFDTKSSAYINLHQYVQKAKLPERDILGIFRKIVEIVERLHNRNVIHSDLKLNNIVLNRVSNKVYITNFCLGRLLPSESALFHDQRGSPAYIAPEILSGKPYRGKPCDMWALGVMLYTMIVGRFPFVDSTPPALFKKIKLVEFTFPPDKKMSSETVALIKSLISLQPEDRYTASETLSAIDMIITKLLGMKQSADQIVPDIDETVKKPARSKPGPSVELSNEQFSKVLENRTSQSREDRLKQVLEERNSQSRENKTFIRPNILSMQRFRSNPILSSSSSRDSTSFGNILGQPRRNSLTHQINNLSIRNRLDETSWHTRLNTGSGESQSAPTSPTQTTPRPHVSTYVQSLNAALSELFTRGRLPTVPNDSPDFNGLITHQLVTKVANFLRENCASHILVRELFPEQGNDSSDRTNVIRLFRLFGVQMEAITDHTVLVKTQQTINNMMFLTFMTQIAGYNNNYFLPVRN